MGSDLKSWGFISALALVGFVATFSVQPAKAQNMSPEQTAEVLAFLKLDQDNLTELRRASVVKIPAAPDVSLKPKLRPTYVSTKFSKSWLATQPTATGGNDWKCLSEALYFEARGESVAGQFAVAEVIMNRVKSARYPGTVCGVINQGTGRLFACQFTYTCDGKAEIIGDPRAYAQVGKVARLTLDGKVQNLTEGATHYHTKAVNPSWARVYPRTAVIGYHLFYRQSYRTAQR